MHPVIGKAFVYITRGNRLLIFSHPLAPEAGRAGASPPSSTLFSPAR